ncbi:MAG: phospholipid transport system substrate-binding protein [Myxococcota bacterium]|jgi:phospholipid transport system substrate-binding protein
MASKLRVVFLGVVASAFALVGTSAFADEVADAQGEMTAARTMVEATVGRILAELAAEGVADDVKIKSLEKIVFGEFDFNTMSRLVLARSYKRFSKEQQQEFEDQFKVYLSRSYGSRLLRYANERVEFKDARVEPRGDVTVMTVIVGGKADGIGMNYRVRNRNDRFKVIDVVIEGISLVSNFRSQFKEIINRDGPDALLARLKDKTFVLPDPETEK